MHEPITSKAYDAWAGVEIFLRVTGRLPQQRGDRLTVGICEEFIERFANHPEHGHWVGYAQRYIARHSISAQEA